MKRYDRFNRVYYSPDSASGNGGDNSGNETTQSSTGITGTQGNKAPAVLTAEMVMQIAKNAVEEYKKSAEKSTEKPAEQKDASILAVDNINKASGEKEKSEAEKKAYLKTYTENELYPKWLEENSSLLDILDHQALIKEADRLADTTEPDKQLKVRKLAVCRAYFGNENNLEGLIPTLKSAVEGIKDKRDSELDVDKVFLALETALHNKAIKVNANKDAMNGNKDSYASLMEKYEQLPLDKREKFLEDNKDKINYYKGIN